jgi:hypothetical protein
MHCKQALLISWAKLQQEEEGFQVHQALKIGAGATTAAEAAAAAGAEAEAGISTVAAAAQIADQTTAAAEISSHLWYCQIAMSAPQL